MKLRNKKTGQTGYYLHTHRDCESGRIKVAVLEDGKPFSEFKPYEPIYDYDSLAELNAEWCDVEDDYEEPKENMQIYQDEGAPTLVMIDYVTKEEAEKAVEKLKAWKRLKDNGFSFHGYDDGYDHNFNSGHIEFYVKDSGDVLEDLDLLFGDEE